MNKHITIQLVIALHISLALAYVGLWIMTAAQGMFWRADFTAYYTGWSMVRDGQGAQLYDLDQQTTYQQHILAGKSFKGGVVPYVNPPHAVVPFVLLAWLPLSQAFGVWAVIQLGLLAWLLVTLLRFAHAWSVEERWLLASGVVAFPPMFVHFMRGSMALVILLALVHYYLALKHRRERAAGVWLAVGSIKPQLMLLPGVIALAARRWKVVLVAAGGVGGWVALSLLYPGWQSWLGFLHAVDKLNTTFGLLGNEPSVMYNIRGTLTLLLGNGEWVLINRVSTVVMVGALLATVWVWRGKWDPNEPLFDVKMAWTLLLGFLCNHHFNPHDGILLLLPVIMFYAYLHKHNLPRYWYGVFVLSLPLLFLLGEFVVKTNLGVRVPVLAMGVLLVWMGRVLVQGTKSPVSP